ncbi:MAG: DUF4956 domain-containing protein [Gemmatimonadales bacterium]
MRQILLYYLVLGGLGVLLVRFLPDVAGSLFGTGGGVAPQGTGLRIPLGLPVAMLGALVLAVPVSWGYMSIRESEGFDQSVVQTIVSLPLVVAAIMLVIQHSLALAFALAGVAAAVRFRNTLKDIGDATFVFLALGIGIAAGVGALGSAAVISMVFTVASVVLWRCDFGHCPTPNVRTVAGKPAGRRGILDIVLHDLGAQGRIERVLDHEVRKWRLVETIPSPGGTVTLRYQVRLRKRTPAALLFDHLRTSADGAVRDAHFEARRVRSSG